MSKSFCQEVIGHPSLYNPQPRKMTIKFEIPEKTSKKTGILLLISGFGGHMDSNVYKKMRRLFSEEMDFITLQCWYFGTEFMQAEIKEEKSYCFNDMGPVQAMDNLIALKCLKNYLETNGILYDDKNVIAYGHSHGAYLALLMNALMPGVLSCIIDNSAWIFPQFIWKNRVGVTKSGEKRVFEYKIGDIIMDSHIYDLVRMYSYNKDNNARIVCFHGLDDELALLSEKILMVSCLQNSSIEIIGDHRIDGTVYKSSEHGLGADFIELFRYAYERYNTKSNTAVLRYSERKFETNNVKYHIKMEDDNIPILYYTPKYNYSYEKLNDIFRDLR